MNTEELYPITDLCKHYEAEISFIHELHESGMVRITTIENKEYIDADMLTNVERLIRMHYELSINFEGLEAIHHLLERVERLQHELQDLHNQLQVYTK